MTTFTTGKISQFVPESLAQVGTLLARLHTLALDSLPSWPAWWNTTYSLPRALQELELVSPAIPPVHRTFYQACHTTLYTMLRALPILPGVFIHADCWMQNAVATRSGMVLIDWESAGCGAAIMDLTDFLLRSQCETHGAPPNKLHEQQLTAAISGYARHRRPSDLELDFLVEATRFSVAWRAAWMFARMDEQGWTPRLEQGIARVQATYAIGRANRLFRPLCFSEME